MSRPCRRNACTMPASASLTFSYRTAQAWLADLAREEEPQQWDLCRSHADVLTVPEGWELVDARSASMTAEDRVEEPWQAHRRVAFREASDPSERTAPAHGRRNRYAALSARLPALAAEVAASNPWLGVRPPTGGEGSAGERTDSSRTVDDGEMAEPDSSEGQ